MAGVSEQRTFLAARIDRWGRERPSSQDLLVAGLMWLFLGLPGLALAGVTGLAVGTLTIGALALRRRSPVGVLGWSVGVFAVQLLVVPIPLPANAAQAVVVYTVAAHVGSSAVRTLALGLGVLGSLAGGFRWSTPPRYLPNALVIGVILAVCTALIWVIGELVRGGRVNTAALHEALRRQERLVAQQRRVLAAAEIHDIVAHSLTVVIVQADAAAYAAEHGRSWQRADAGAALTTVAGTARTALAEVRGVIEMLHRPEPAEQSPGAAVTWDQVRRLIESVRAAGLPVDHTGAPAWFDELPGEVRLTVFRAVREALTNVLKHAGAGATAELTFDRDGDTVRVRVEDDGPAGNTPVEPGHGLTGLRERLRPLDGVLTAGPRLSGGFAVDVTIPGGRR
ncbi:sensor histidine kinase [Actinoplanes derwentensis]|uniref:sensor histidine kinase n=1 Tax=Actinoplanes derwentensis TaxID=113562 RepID=UPI000B80AE0C|nr:histidine kinase [Actinoplanes derwentensis]